MLLSTLSGILIGLSMVASDIFEIVSELSSDVVDVYTDGEQYILFEHTPEGNLRYLDTVETKREVIEEINGMKVTLKSR